MTNDDLTLKAELSAQRTQLADVLQRLAKAEGTIEQLNKSIASGNRMTNWQFVGFVAVMAGTLFGAMYWATSVIERRVDQVERNLTKVIQQSGDNTNKRLDDGNRRFDDMNKRFDDLGRYCLLNSRNANWRSVSI
jgi:hypothetical protein